MAAVPYRTTTPSALAAASSSSARPALSRMAAIAAAPQMDTPVAMSSDVPGLTPSARPMSWVVTNVSPVATVTIASVRQPSPSTSGRAICRPSRAIATRSTRLETNASPGRNRVPMPVRLAMRAPARTAMTAGLSAGTYRLTIIDSAVATTATRRPGHRSRAFSRTDAQVVMRIAVRTGAQAVAHLVLRADCWVGRAVGSCAMGS